MAEQVEKNTLEQLAEDIEQPVEEEPKEEESKSDSDVITEEYVKEAGLPESFVGKKFSDGVIAKHLKSLTGEFTKKSQKASELEKRLESLEAKMNQGATTKQEKEEVKDLFEKMPDPYDNPNEFKAWIKDAVREAETKAEQRALKKVEEEYGTIKKESAEMKRERFLADLTKEIPEGIDPIEAIDEWAEKSGEVQDQDDVDYYLSKPNKMIKLISRYYEGKAGIEKSKSKGDERFKEVKKNLKSTSGSELNTNDRTKKESGVLADLANDLAEQAGISVGE